MNMLKDAVAIAVAEVEAEYKLRMEAYEQRFKTQQNMCSSLMTDLEKANKTIHSLKQQLNSKA
jgi:hypothetical protein